jgi:RNase H-like domain found in reverse transcriptase
MYPSTGQLYNKTLSSNLKINWLLDKYFNTLTHNNLFFFKTDASDKAISEILSQTSMTNNKLQSIAFYSQILSPAKLNYEIHAKKSLAIVASLQKWRAYLKDTNFQITIYSDHSNFLAFTTIKQLNQRQNCWSKLLTGYDFVIKHISGSSNAKADALSQRPDYMATPSIKLSPAILQSHQMVMVTMIDPKLVNLYAPSTFQTSQMI